LIRDRFAPPKEVTRQQVIDRYHLVKQHDRVGHMSDAWEFSYTAFPMDRFTDELLAELQSDAESQVIIEDDRLIIKHLFIERRLEPLNLYLARTDTAGATHAVREFGDAILEIAAGYWKQLQQIVANGDFAE
jgi:isocitrate dehydrogenase kinase/phosphatase